MIANNTGEVIESDEYGETVFHAVDDIMDEQNFSLIDKIIQLSWEKIRSQTKHI